MSGSGGLYAQNVRGATKIKAAAPKSKYIQSLLDATNQGEGAIAEVFRALHPRLKDTSWTVVFKALLVIHMLIRDGYKDAGSRTFRVTSLTSTGCSPLSEQGKNISDYGVYLTMRIKAFAGVKQDYVKSKSELAGQGRLRKLTVEKGLLRETEVVQNVIEPLIQCTFVEGASDNEITLTAFRLLVADLLVLFQVANEGVINVLEHYFEMSKLDAERALKIYKRFVEQTDGVITYMSLARSLEAVTRLTIPNLQHAPTSLGSSLEEYLQDPDFEQNRIQYLAQKGLKGQGALGSSSSSNAGQAKNPLKSALKSSSNNSGGNPFGAPQLPQQISATGNADLIDFFDSIEPQRQSAQSQAYSQQQQPPIGNVVPEASSNPYMIQQMQPQFTQSMPQQYTGYQQQPQQPQIQPQYTSNGYNPYNSNQQVPQLTGTGFGGYTPQQPQIQPQYTASLQPQATGSNPFRKSIAPQQMYSQAQAPELMSPQRTGNPFQRMNGAPPTTGTPLYAPQQQSPISQQYPQYTNQPISQQTTGNPFQRQQQSMTGMIQPQLTDSSNPFRKSQMVPTYHQYQ